MSNEFESSLEPSERSALEQSLAAIQPSPAGVDRDRLMFLAGVASASASGASISSVNPKSKIENPKSRWIWPAATTSLAATSLALAMALFLRPDPAARIVFRDRLVEVQPVAVDESKDGDPAERTLATGSTRSPTVRSISGDNYVRRRDIALKHGLDALGTTYATGGQTPSPLTYGDWLSTSTPLGGAVEKPIRRPFDL